MKVKITGTGSRLPKLRVTNDDLGQIMETSDEWIRSRTGICLLYTSDAADEL